MDQDRASAGYSETYESAQNGWHLTFRKLEEAMTRCVYNYFWKKATLMWVLYLYGLEVRAECLCLPACTERCVTAWGLCVDSMCQHVSKCLAVSVCWWIKYVLSVYSYLNSLRPPGFCDPAQSLAPEPGPQSCNPPTHPLLSRGLAST